MPVLTNVASLLLPVLTGKGPAEEYEDPLVAISADFLLGYLLHAVTGWDLAEENRDPIVLVSVNVLFSFTLPIFPEYDPPEQTGFGGFFVVWDLSRNPSFIAPWRASFLALRALTRFETCVISESCINFCVLNSSSFWPLRAGTARRPPRSVLPSLNQYLVN